VPDPQDEATFERSKLDWAERESGGHVRMLTVYRDLIALRRNESDLGDFWLDHMEVDFDEDARWIVLIAGHSNRLQPGPGFGRRPCHRDGVRLGQPAAAPPTLDGHSFAVLRRR
jgi:maltooligosyltrehalose trehalohydrolase